MDYDKYGESAFILKRQEVRSLKKRIKKEQFYLDNMPYLYNICKGSVFGDALTLHPNRDAIVHKRNESCKSRYAKMSPEARSAIYGSKGPANGMYGKTHTQKSKKKFRKTLDARRKSGEISALPPNTRPVNVNGIDYESATAAARYIWCCTATVLNRIKSSDFDYYYL